MLSTLLKLPTYLSISSHKTSRVSSRLSVSAFSQQSDKAFREKATLGADMADMKSHLIPAIQCIPKLNIKRRYIRRAALPKEGKPEILETGCFVFFKNVLIVF
jgi:hypothetical protein